MGGVAALPDRAERNRLHLLRQREVNHRELAKLHVRLNDDPAHTDVEVQLVVRRHLDWDLGQDVRLKTVNPNRALTVSREIHPRLVPVAGFRGLLEDLFGICLDLLHLCRARKSKLQDAWREIVNLRREIL